MAKKRKKPARRRARNTHKGSWESIPTAPLMATTAAAKDALDEMELVIRWTGGNAFLLGLVDNGTTVAFDPRPEGAAGLRATWVSREAGSHFLQFALAFEGTRTNLSATARIDKSGGFDAPVKKKSADAVWFAHGDVVPEAGE